MGNAQSQEKQHYKSDDDIYKFGVDACPEMSNAVTFLISNGFEISISQTGTGCKITSIPKGWGILQIYRVGDIFVDSEKRIKLFIGDKKTGDKKIDRKSTDVSAQLFEKEVYRKHN